MRIYKVNVRFVAPKPFWAVQRGLGHAVQPGPGTLSTSVVVVSDASAMVEGSTGETPRNR
jgi:hypothetical protein